MAEGIQSQPKSSGARWTRPSSRWKASRVRRSEKQSGRDGFRPELARCARIPRSARCGRSPAQRIAPFRLLHAPADLTAWTACMNRGTLTQLFFTTVDRHGTLPAAFRSKVGGAWQSVTHREALEHVEAISIGLREIGLQPGDKVAIVSENRPEWALADYACLCAQIGRAHV